MKKKVKRGIKYFKEKADKIFSKLIRLRAAKSDGYVKCVTCGRSLHWKESQCGHYVPRNKLSLRFSDKNCHVQCLSCNMFRKGNMDEYARFMVAQYGPYILEELAVEKAKAVKFSIADYQEMIEEWEDELFTLDQKIKDRF